MGLFQSKQQPKLASPDEEMQAAVAALLDDQYRDELRNMGREYFQTIVSENAGHLKQSIDEAVTQVSVELKDYMTAKLDGTIMHVNSELAGMLERRLAESDRITKDAQDLAVQSLNRNAQALHDKYQQLAQALQQSIASQEAMMITVFEENKARMITTQGMQDTVLQSLKESAQTSRDQTQQLRLTLQQIATEQEAAMAETLNESRARVAATKQAQDTALAELNRSAEALQQQHQQMSAMLQKTASDQEAMLVGVFQDNMARVVEHYVLGALGDQYDMKAQLPSIIAQMEVNKQAMMDDMKL